MSQKSEWQIALHQIFLLAYPDKKVLEISSTSLMSPGSRLSAMNLGKRTQKGLTTVESAFQSSRIYVEAYYAEHCSMLTNRKEEDNYPDNYPDLRCE